MPTATEFQEAAASLHDVAAKYAHFQKDEVEFLEAIHEMPRDALRNYRTAMRDAVTRRVDGVRQIRPVTFLRIVIVDRILDGDDVSADDIRHIQDRIDARDAHAFSNYGPLQDEIANQKERTYSAFHVWNLFRILHGIHYHSRAAACTDHLTTITSFLQSELSLNECDSKIAGFAHNQNFGTDWCWVSLYPGDADGHKVAHALQFTVRPGQYEFGLSSGNNTAEDQSDMSILPVDAPPPVDAMLERYRELQPRFYEVNRQRTQTHGAKPLADTRSVDQPLAQILYGPPGTGKTYAARRRAVDVIDGPDPGRSDAEVTARFRALQDEGRIGFTTFHPSFAYEEFVEGLRYDRDKGFPTVEDGILKTMAARAQQGTSPPPSTDTNETVWKLSLGRKTNPAIFERCMQDDEIGIGFVHDEDLSGLDSGDLETLFEQKGRSDDTNAFACLNYFANEMEVGDWVAVYKDRRSIRAIGRVTGPYRFRPDVDEYPHVRSVEWLDRSEHDVYALNGRTHLTRQTMYPLHRIQPSDLQALFDTEGAPDPGEAPKQPVVLIMDEINRGNLARIFGELVTLLEPDKRAGAANAVQVTLPYSKERFALPDTLYLIGTMNTADRSIALLDAALRRRFEFKEIMPSSTVLLDDLTARADAAEEGDDVELSSEQIDLIKTVFVTLNNRITAVLDRDHQIGHSYFLGLTSMEDLHDVWYNRIVHLVKEYFYNDLPRLKAVLGAYEAEANRGFIHEMPHVDLPDASVPGTSAVWEVHTYPKGQFESALRASFA